MDADSPPAASTPRERVLELARNEGFSTVRIASAEVLAAPRETALARQSVGMLADMAWMTPDWLHRATDPDAFLEGARSIILLALPYSPSPPFSDSSSPEKRERGPGGEGPNRKSQIANRKSTGRIAHYARGRDYHRVFEKRLRRIARIIREEFGAGARATVDYGPLLERPLAARAGMGWLGKSTMLLVPGFGPWVLLGAIATTLDLPPDEPLRKTCGSCTRCIVACPTGAISPEGNVLDSRLCISYHTIENRGPIPRELRPKFGNWIFGCDDCLSSCPVGIRHTAGEPDFEPASPWSSTPPLAPLLSMTEEDFAERYRGQAIKRAKRDGFLRNVCIALGNTGTLDDLDALEGALDDDAPLVRGHAAWALAELGARHNAHDRAVAALEARRNEESDAFVNEELDHALDVLTAS
jgi:epoxyqueuosine reductase